MKMKMKTKTTKILVGMVAVCLAFGALADGPTISDVVVRQRWPWSSNSNFEPSIVNFGSVCCWSA